MKIGKCSIWILVGWLFVLLLGGCDQWGADQAQPFIIDEMDQPETEATPEVAASDITVALVMKTLTNPFFIEMEKGARQAEAELGITLLVKTGAQETSVEQQITIIDNLIEDQVDAIVIAPADSTKLIPVLKKAQDAGIVIINVDNQLDPEAAEQIGLVGVPFISVDNEQGAYLSAGFISAQITTPTQAIILEGIRTAKNAEDRKNGALRAFDENRNIEVVAMETAHWKIDEAYQVTEQLFAQYPDIGAVFCANDMMALGVLRYLEETSRTDVLVSAYDALAEAKEALRAGTLQATIDQQAALQAYTGVKFAVRALNGETLPMETIVDVILVTQADVE
jgi:ribose transport system substrate-binding protein